jgi:outer membrane receptor for ferrienterochelin and colicins
VGNLKNTKNWARMGLAMGGAIGGMVGTTGSTAAYGAEMTPDMTGGTQIVVTASTRAQSVKDAPASISVITREDIERLPYREVTDALMEIPGVTVTTGEGNSRDISIRDMAPQYTLILETRRLSALASRTSGRISEGGLLPPIETIDHALIRGPMSSLYGSDVDGRRGQCAGPREPAPPSGRGLPITVGCPRHAGQGYAVGALAPPLVNVVGGSAAIAGDTRRAMSQA